MGRDDIHVVPIPHGDLQSWWHGMTESNKEYVTARIGFLINLIYIKSQVPLIQALAKYWEVSTASFVMGQIELTPTLEEYEIAIGVEFKERLVQPPVGMEILPMLVDYLNVEAEEIERVLKKSMGRLPLRFLLNLPKERGTMSARVFILVFFGFVLFPCSATAMDPVVTCIARQACFKWNYSNMMLAETIMSLNRYEKNQEERLTQVRRNKPKTFFKGSTGMLYMWFIAHIRSYSFQTHVDHIDASSHPLERFMKKHHQIPKHEFHDWANLIGQLTPSEIRWRISWPKMHQVRLTSAEGDMVPLLGFNGGTAYCPLRVIRQYGVLQEIPPAWSPDLFEFELKHYVMGDQEKAIYQAKVDRIVRALRSMRQDVTWPEELEDEMKLYWASEEYVAFSKTRRILDDGPETPPQEEFIDYDHGINEIRDDEDEMEPNPSMVIDPADEYQNWVEHSEELEDEDRALATKKSKLG